MTETTHEQDYRQIRNKLENSVADAVDALAVLKVHADDLLLQVTSWIEHNRHEDGREAFMADLERFCRFYHETGYFKAVIATAEEQLLAAVPKEIVA